MDRILINGVDRSECPFRFNDGYLVQISRCALDSTPRRCKYGLDDYEDGIGEIPHWCPARPGVSIKVGKV